MPYVGRDLQRGNYLKLDDIGSSFNGSTTTFNLTSGGNAFFPGSAFSILVSLGGVVQEPESAYQIDRSQIIFATAPTSSSDFFCIALGVALGVGVPGHNTVGNNQLAKPISYGDYFRWDSANNRVGITLVSLITRTSPASSSLCRSLKRRSLISPPKLASKRELSLGKHGF